jgi:hypothetical protein
MVLSIFNETLDALVTALNFAQEPQVAPQSKHDHLGMLAPGHPCGF